MNKIMWFDLYHELSEVHFTINYGITTLCEQRPMDNKTWNICSCQRMKVKYCKKCLERILFAKPSYEKIVTISRGKKDIFVYCRSVDDTIDFYEDYSFKYPDALVL